MTISCAIGLPAYNEAENIGNLLEVLLSQKLQQVSLDQIIVVASGCTDGTEDIVREYMKRDNRIELIVQSQRRGKASAVNIIIEQNQSDVIMLHSTDVLPAEDVVEKLISPFSDPEVGITGGRPVPTNNPDDFVGYIVHILWRLHHEISKRSPKMGEVIAFRPVLRRIPEDTPVDEASIEPLIIGQGYQLRYIDDAKVYNHGPTTITDFLKQRRRIYTGHLYLQGLVGYRVATMSPPKLALVFLRRMFADLSHFPQYVAAAFLEVYGRVLGWYDWKIRKARPYIWSIAETTKVKIEAPPGDPTAAPGEPAT